MADKPSPGHASLVAYAERIAQRHTEIEQAFNGSIYAPADNRDYIKFVKDMVAEVACRYVMTGTMTPLDETARPVGEVDKKAIELREKGFSVSGDPAVAAELKSEQPADADGTKAVPDTKSETADRDFLESNFMKNTRALGFDPDSDEESFPTTLRK